MKKNKQRLQIYTSLWSMKPHDNTGNILSHEDICLKVKDAGFAGLALDLGASDVNEANAIRPYLEKNDGSLNLPDPFLLKGMENGVQKKQRKS